MEAWLRAAPRLERWQEALLDALRIALCCAATGSLDRSQRIVSRRAEGPSMLLRSQP
jgi:hypothetical protein